MSAHEIEAKIFDVLPVIRRYPENIQVDILKYYLVYLLKGSDKQELVVRCKVLRETVFFSSQFDCNSVLSDIEQLLASSSGNCLDDRGRVGRILSQLEEIKSTLNIELKVSETDLGENLSILEMVNQLVKINYSKTALNKTVEEILDRVLESLDPQKVENYVDQSIVRKEIEHKAALYDAMCEKYEHIFDYNESGRLLKDFRRLFKNNMKNK